MPLAKISGAGLGAIALLVAVLWCCILGEHLIVQQANREYSQALSELRGLQFKKRFEPAAAPQRNRPAVRRTIG